jgi:hypothetical protein
LYLSTRDSLFLVLALFGAAEAEEDDDERESADEGEDGFSLIEERGAAEALPKLGEELRVCSGA